MFSKDNCPTIADLRSDDLIRIARISQTPSVLAMPSTNNPDKKMVGTMKDTDTPPDFRRADSALWAANICVPYVLMTAAHNEEEHVEATIKSVLAQSVLPRMWIIVSDSSTDLTDTIVEDYARRYDFIRFLRVTRPPGRSFRSKAMALQAGCRLLDGVHYESIGNIDADVTIGSDYFVSLIDHLQRHPSVGLAGGYIYERRAGQFRNRRSNRTYSISHAAQLLRRECFDAIGGYAVLRYGGEDWYAQTLAKMKGWQVQAIPALQILHHRNTGAGTNLLRDRFRLGRLDYSFGTGGLFEILKCAARLPEEPLVLGAVARFAGFCWSSICGEARPVSDAFIEFLRSEQKAKVSALFRGGTPQRYVGERT